LKEQQIEKNKIPAISVAKCGIYHPSNIPNVVANISE
jgi:hypothetical protein